MRQIGCWDLKVKSVDTVEFVEYVSSTHLNYQCTACGHEWGHGEKEGEA